VHREIKETLNAKSEYTEDGDNGHPHHVINQYVIKEEIGRGSYGAVHIARDQYGQEYVSRLRHRC
jgi:[calcium/calmodulin-dependent protein kinase] kinase